MRDLLRYVRARQTPAASADFAQAVAAFNADHPVMSLLERHSVAMRRTGAEWHTVNGCPLPACASTHDAFRAHPDRSPGDPRGPQWACRKCGRGGDALRLAMHLDAHNPNQPGETARFLVARGYLQPRGRPPERKPTPTPTTDTPENNLGAITAYEADWLAEREAILTVDGGMDEAEAAAEARRLLAVIHAREGAARGKR